MRRVCLGGGDIWVEVRETAFDRFHDGVEVDTGATVVDGVVDGLRVYGREPTELVSTENSDHLADVLSADIVPEQIDTFSVDAEHVEYKQAVDSTVKRIGIHLLSPC